jgi:NhaA family Na+:H+ antiporter
MIMPAVVVWEGLRVAGVHPALAGVLLGLVTPPGDLEDRLHPWVAYGVMPLFALANAGVDLRALDLAHTHLVGAITLGLVAGKLVGVAGATALAVALRVARLPDQLRARDVVLVGLAAGIGFTMSLFVAQLAFANAPELYAAARAGVLLASLLAALLALGYARLSAGSRR